MLLMRLYKSCTCDMPSRTLDISGKQGFKISVEVLWSVQQGLRAQATLSSDERTLEVALPIAAAATPQHEQHEGERSAFEAALARRIAGLLGSSKTMSPAVGLLLHFRELAAQACDRQAVLGELAAAGQLGLAMCWADQLGPTFQVLKAPSGGFTGNIYLIH